MLGRAAGLGQMGAAQDWSPCESQLTSCGTKGSSREGQLVTQRPLLFLSHIQMPMGGKLHEDKVQLKLPADCSFPGQFLLGVG